MEKMKKNLVVKNVEKDIKWISVAFVNTLMNIVGILVKKDTAIIVIDYIT